MENGLKNEGVNCVIKNGRNLEKLNLSKNGVNHHLAEELSRLLE